MKLRYLKNVATLHVHQEKCVGCGLCTQVCPHQILRLQDGKVSITDLDLCMECGACALNCAFAAIEVKKGVGCAAAVINSLLKGGEPSCDCSGSDGEQGCC